jgi:thioredoxin 1
MISNINRLLLLTIITTPFFLNAKKQVVSAKPVKAAPIEAGYEAYYPQDYRELSSCEPTEPIFEEKAVAPTEELEVEEQEEAVSEAHSAYIKELQDLKKDKETLKETFNREVIKSKKPTVVKFTATWCGPCQQMAPAFGKAADHFGDKVSFIEIDIDKCPDVAKAYKVQSVPQMHFYNKGKKITVIGGGLTNPQQIIDQIKMHLKIK